MAHKKGVGSSRNGRDSNPKFRGIKKYGGEYVTAGNIIARQCGTKWHPGSNVGMGTDYTIYSACSPSSSSNWRPRKRSRPKPLRAIVVLQKPPPRAGASGVAGRNFSPPLT